MSQDVAGPETFGDVLRREREAAGLTQEELAERAGLSRNAISALERGDRRRPYPFTVRSLIAALGLSPGDGSGLAAAVPARIRAGADIGRQVGSAESAAASIPGQLSIPLFGREREVAEAVNLLSSGTTRLLTLVGPGGVGKTRLSLAVAEVLAPHLRDGVTIVALAPIADPGLVLPAIAIAIGLREENEGPAIETVIARLHDLDRLLVLDNAEHLTAIGPALADLLAACTGLKLLVTSRESLRIRDEYVVTVPPLALPDLTGPVTLESIAAVPSVALFVQRASSVASDFQLTKENASAVAGICTRLDGLPLAIELAAVRVRLLPPRALLARLERRLPMLGDGPRDAPERHRTLRRTIAWSYDLLTPDEQRLFRRMAVFAGGATIEAVEALTWSLEERGFDESDVLDLLGQLVNKSLLRPAGVDAESPRVEMLETVREFAWERLIESGEQDAGERAHAVHYAALVERTAPDLLGVEQERWLTELDRERFNLDAALAWSLQHRQIEIALTIGVSLHRFWHLRGYLTVGRGWLRRVLDVSGGVDADGPPHLAPLRARAFRAAGSLAYVQGDSSGATALLERGLRIARVGDDLVQIALMLNELANAVSDTADYARSAELGEESLALLRASGDRRGVALVLANQGVLADRQGDMRLATRLYSEGLELFQELGIRSDVAFTQSNLAAGLVLRGEVDRAESLYLDSLALAQAIGDARLVAICVHGLGDVARWRGAAAEAISHYEESLARYSDVGDIRNQALVLMTLSDIVQDDDPELAVARAEEGLRLAQRVGDTQLEADAIIGLGHLSCRQGDLAHGADRYREGFFLYQGLGTPAGLAPSLEGFSAMLVAQGSKELAVRFLAFAAALRDAQGIPLPLSAQADHERFLTLTRENLSGSAFEAAWQEGQVMAVNEVFKMILDPNVIGG